MKTLIKISMMVAVFSVCAAFAAETYSPLRARVDTSAALLGKEAAFARLVRITMKDGSVEEFLVESVKTLTFQANTEVSFKTDYYDAEKLSVNVQSGAGIGSFLFYLRDVEYIDFVKVNSKSDTDGDGLSDIDEIYKIGTNPRMADTDGDGYDDGTEMNLFNPQNPTVWNPNVADLPKLEVTMTPSVTLTRTTSTGTTRSSSISEGESVQTATGVSNSETQSASLMSAWSFGIQGGSLPKARHS